LSSESSNSQNFPLPKDLNVFLTVIRQQSFTAAAEELGQSPAYISKRIGVLESMLKTRLLHLTTRRLVLTDDGERTQRWAMRILNDFEDMVGDLTQAQQVPRGLIHICSSFGFGRKRVAPALSMLTEKYPELEARLEVFDRAVDIIPEGFDLEIRVGEDLPQQHICKLLKPNVRVLCAAPEYLEQRGTPQTLDDLQNHDCLVLKERNSSFGLWNLTRRGKRVTVPIGGSLSSGRGKGAELHCAPGGMPSLTSSPANWFRCCPNTDRKPMSTRFIQPVCRTPPNYGCVSNFLKAILSGCPHTGIKRSG